MIELYYSSANLYVDACGAIDRNECIRIRIARNIAPFVRRALCHYNDYFDQKAKGKKNLLLLYRFGWYGIRTPWLWGILIKAELMGAKVTTSSVESDLLIVIEPKA